MWGEGNLLGETDVDPDDPGFCDGCEREIEQGRMARVELLSYEDEPPVRLTLCEYCLDQVAGDRIRTDTGNDFLVMVEELPWETT